MAEPGSDAVAPPSGGFAPYVEEMAAKVFAAKEKMQQCQGNVRGAAKNMTVRFMRDKIEAAGCPLPPDFVRCATCEGLGDVTGGFLARTAGVEVYKPGIEMCPVGLPQRFFTQMLVHELVHAYDQCTRKIRWENPVHLACSEIRAASLSGECGYARELLRGNTTMQGQHPVCVKRRAALSVAMHHGEEVAKRAIDKAFDACYADTQPFERHPAHPY